ncbi:MAG: YicC/YloC family endoribonuclease [Planctomycetota bacterium]
MLRSMTGFGSALEESARGSWRVEVRSVNHRHLNVKAHLPAELVHLETDLERLVRRRLVRGAVTVFVTVLDAPAAETVSLDPRAAAHYRDEWGRLAADLGIGAELSASALLDLPGVIVHRAAPGRDAGAEDHRILRLAGEALERLAAMRATEGEALAADLRRHAAACGRIAAQIEKRMPAVVRRHRSSLRRRVAELLAGGAGLDPAELAREVALLADRLDVSEELSRLKSHLDQLDRILERGGAVGRKLDFLVQEILREVNTIGSKCSDAKVAHWVVDAKTHVERLREQVQNVE